MGNWGGWYKILQAPGDVSKTAPTNGQILKYNTTTLQWEVSDEGLLGATGAVYLGDPATDGTWRIIRDGNNLSFQRRESGTYIEKGANIP